MDISSRGECLKMLEVVSKHNIKVKEVPKATELAHSEKMQGKPVILIENEVIENEGKSGITMV
jgi:propanol-preferring alcohol dehydrogenase